MSDFTHIAARWPRVAKMARADYDCVIGRDFTIKPAILQDFSANLLSPVEQDLVALVGAVAYADRVVRRRRGKGWTRDIHLSLPVQAHAVWERPAVQNSLTDALSYVTGDNWTFRFLSGAKPLTVRQSSLDFKRGSYVVLPFSDGLDSFLQWQLLKKEEPDANILRVHTASRASNKERNTLIDAFGGSADQRLAMPISLSVRDHAEPTYRTRTFLFFLIAALAAHKFGTKRVVIGENGVGTYGPGMVPFGGEYPHRTTHPAFTRRLSVFINRLLESEVVFEHPQQFRTKGQVLKHAVRLGVRGWERTHSCTRNARNQLDKLPCGICGGCLLRCTAMHAAGLSDGKYFWDDLSGMSLDDCRSRRNARVAKPSDIDIARHGILDMSGFAELGLPTTPKLPFDRVAWEVVGKADASLRAIASDISQLARDHAEEWEAFKARYTADGFLNGQQV